MGISAQEAIDLLDSSFPTSSLGMHMKTSM
jgi:hypothetical protein